MQSEFEDYEDKTGLKFAFNVFPRTKAQESKCVIPISCLYQPLKPKNDPVLINRHPIACSTCQSIVNSFCLLDGNSRAWTCSVCNQRNQFHSSVTSIPQEIVTPGLLDVEYVLPDNEIIQYTKPVVFLYVVDISLDDVEFDALIESLTNSLSLLPPNSVINLITFGKNVNIYELAIENHISSYTFNGYKDYTNDEISKKLGLMEKNNAQTKDQNSKENRFFQNVSICEFSLTNLLRSLRKDSFKVEKYNRNYRATGCAINIAFKLLNIIYPKDGAKILLFTGGVATIGPGSIVSTSFKEPIRSHSDFLKDSKVKKKFNENKNFYNNLGERASINGHSIDIFIGCYDQVGLYEMESLVDKTGGVIVQSDSFTSAIFKQSFNKFLSVDEYGEAQFGMNATLAIKCKNIKVNSFIGHATPLKFNLRKDLVNNGKIQFFNDNKKNIVGYNGTNIFKLSSVSAHSTYAVYFELDEHVIGDYSIIQFITNYQHVDGSRRVHVTTTQRFINQSADNSESIIQYFDQEAATVLIARMAIFKVVNDSTDVALKFINKVLVDFLSNFAQYRTNDAKSIVIPPSINLLPQFMYHLRRSNFIQIFNSSPDETAFYRHCLLTEDCINSLIMIQPTLTSYEIENQDPEPVLLDSTSIKPNRILFLDTFFHILIYHGSLIADWRRQGYQDQPDYEYFKSFLQLPRQEAADILIDRFPLPRFIDTEEGGSQARFLMSKLNPTNSYNNNSTDSLQHLAQYGNNSQESGAIILTDDISLQTFMQFVYDAVVKPT